MTLKFHTSAKGWPTKPLNERVPNIIENGKWIFCIFEVKEADEFTKTVEVIIAYGANEATEVVRFTLGT